MTNRRRKILINCYACSPIRGSEPGMGWNFVKHISKHHDLWVITEKEKFEKEINSELERHPELRERIRFYFIPKTRHRTLRKLWPPSYYWFYKSWQKKVYALARELHEQVRFDLVHQLNMVGFREPGYLWKLDVPFVWGPVGGMQKCPWQFVPSLGFAGAIFHSARNLINAGHMHWRVRVRQAVSHTRRGALIAASSEIAQKMRKHWGAKSVVLSEIGQVRGDAGDIAMRMSSAPLRIAWCGVHEPRKALPLLLSAIEKLTSEMKCHVDIMGQGGCSERWKKTAVRLGIADACTWHGWLPRDKAIEIMSAAHVLVITSLVDLTSTVTLEALSNGVPVICLDHCGFADVVNDSCGIKIAVTSPKQASQDIADALRLLYQDEPFRQKLALGALKRAADYSWDKKMEVINGIYNDAVKR